MSKITIRALGVISSHLENFEGELNIQEGSSVEDILCELDELNPGLKSLLIDPALKSHLPNTLILLNGVEIGNISGLDTPVLDGDEIMILSVTHGG